MREVATVAGSVGTFRFWSFLLLQGCLLVVSGIAALLGQQSFGSRGAAFGAIALVPLAFCYFTFAPPCIAGAARLIDVSVPVRFRLSNSGLVVWQGLVPSALDCCGLLCCPYLEVQWWDLRVLQGAAVYKQGCKFMYALSERGGRVVVPLLQPPDRVQAVSDVRAELPSFCCCFRIWFGRCEEATCAFLGARVRGELVQLSRLVWHNGGHSDELEELFSLAARIQEQVRSWQAARTAYDPVPAAVGVPGFDLSDGMSDVSTVASSADIYT